MCYTNHALNQFLEDLLDIGITPEAITRLGSKATDRTRQLSLSEQKSQYKRQRSSWKHINGLEQEGMEREQNLNRSFQTYQNPMTGENVMNYLEWEDTDFYEALTVPEFEGYMTNMKMVDEHGNDVDEYYLYRRWIKGHNAGIFAKSLPVALRHIWKMDKGAREEKLRSWKRALLEEHTTNLKNHAAELDQCQESLKIAWNDQVRHTLNAKRIIGCTTTGAAMYSKDLRTVSPGITLLEEAGEILESHVLTALTQDTEQLVLIGDHMQLRPKINSYALSVEKGDGYDLNVSLFERLIHMDYPHTTLLKQHRMCPEISSLVRNLTYPNLEDDPKTKNRSMPKGLQDRVIFLQHEHKEATFAEVSDKRDEGSKQSKRNPWEAEIILQIVKYLGQQGYGTDKLIVLTPYLGQLHLLQDVLRKQNDPVLNDLDSHDLVRAGLVSNAAASHGKKKLRLSTIGTHRTIMFMKRRRSSTNPSNRQLSRRRKRCGNSIAYQK